MLKLWSHLELYMNLAGLDYPYLVPPDAEHKDWRQFDKVVAQTRATDAKNPMAAAFSSILFHYQTNDPGKFNGDVAYYQSLLQEHNSSVLGRMGFEVFFNQLSPFYLCVVLYVGVFFLAWFSFLMRAGERSPWAETLGKAAFWLAVFTFAIHTFGLVARIYLQGRPPVTNLYSSAVFIGWGAVLLSLLLELPFRLSIGTLLASVIGFVTLVIAMNLAEGDTMEMMQAVLDSNFWLATHVVVVTAGYAATFLAGLIGVMYILLGTTTRIITPELDRVFTRMVYGVICFALLLSFTGTVLGGIWADQSWGRFWGWDPKENGAVLIVIWNALILHARWGGMVKTRGIMALAVFGNIVTAWSWFGTNMLGVGLHSYGFMQSAVFWLAAFMLSQLAIILVSQLPLPLWKSFAPVTADDVPAQEASWPAEGASTRHHA
jgi:ABC-type transport system involved in cytochrome c biogenesis permease subunit